jgi:hypothetical protein
VGNKSREDRGFIIATFVVLVLAGVVAGAGLVLAIWWL